MTTTRAHPPSAAGSSRSAGSARSKSSESLAYVPGAYHAQQWAKFLRRSLRTRLDFDRFSQFAPIQRRKHPISPVVLADIFLRPSAKTQPYIQISDNVCHSSVDPCLPFYLKTLLELGYVDVVSVLQGLYRYSSLQAARRGAAAAAAAAEALDGQDGQDGGSRSTPRSKKDLASGAGSVIWGSSSYNEETMFYRIARAVRQENAIRGKKSALAVAAAMAAWMQLFVTAASSFATAALVPTDMAEQASKQASMEACRTAYVMLLLAVLDNGTVLNTLKKPSARGVRRALSRTLPSFTPLIAHASAAAAARLDHFCSDFLAQFDQDRRRKESEADDDNIHDLLDATVGLQNLVLPELPISNSRAGLYIYLNAALVGRPLVDDAAIFAYLHNRYQGDLQSTAIDLILASFDVLANAVFRREGQTSAHLLRSYLVNKVPLLLASLAASPLYPFDSQFCISEALSRVDTNAFPSMFDDNQNANTFTDSVRQDFCFSCCLHGLIPESSIETLLGEMTYQSLPAGGRYTKQQLVQQCLGDYGQIETLVGQLDNMDGNVGTASQALVEVLGHLCRTRETATLKTLCNSLVKKPLAFDVLLLFERPSAILYPLCQLLDGWRYEDDQSEYQPVYEEFGSVLILLLAFVYRYDLSIADLGIQWSADSFVAKILSVGPQSRTLVELSDQERENLGNWIRGLFDTEAGGLSDDLMASCPPQQFYMLTPTLFQQIIQATSTGALKEEALKIGIEYLVDTFLLPSLVTALTYLSSALKVDKPVEQKAIIRILQLILQPASISSEASLMLTALLNIVAKPVEHALLIYQSQDPRNEDIDPLLNALKQSIPRSRRTAAAEHNELVSWARSSSGAGGAGSSSASHAGGGGVPTAGGLYAAVRQTMQSFVQWSLHPGVNVMPTSYTHRQFLAGLSLIGAARILQLILDEVQRQTEAGNGSVVYDVACALICAADVTNEPSPDSLYVLVDGAGPSGETGDANDASDANGANNANNTRAVAGTVVANPATVQRRISLRQALAFKAQEWKKIQQSHHPADVAMAEAVVRLHRKVEAQMAPPPPPPPTLPAQSDLSAGLDAAVAAAAAAGLDDATMDIVAAAAAASGPGPEDGMALDGVDLTSLQGGGGADGGPGTAGPSGSAGDLGDMVDLGDLGSLNGLGDLGDLSDLGMGGSGGDKSSLDLGDQSMFGEMDLLNSWMNLQ